MAVAPRGPMDEVIQLRLLELTQGSSLVEGLVLAGTIVEGGPVFGRPRRILGGQSVHPGLKLLDFAFKIVKCPTFTFGYHCKNWVSPECAVTRHMMFRMKLCTCVVDVC
jgi:hypothetical protein